MDRHETYKDSGVEWIGEIPESSSQRRIWPDGSSLCTMESCQLRRDL